MKVMLRKFTGEKSISVGQNLFVASLAGVVNVLLTCPLWVANTRIKLQKNASAKDSTVKPYKGLMDCMDRIYREEGGLALWNGAGMIVLFLSLLFSFFFNATFVKKRKVAHKKNLI